MEKKRGKKRKEGRGGESDVREGNERMEGEEERVMEEGRVRGRLNLSLSSKFPRKSYWWWGLERGGDGGGGGSGGGGGGEREKKKRKNV